KLENLEKSLNETEDEFAEHRKNATEQINALRKELSTAKMNLKVKDMEIQRAHRQNNQHLMKGNQSQRELEEHTKLIAELKSQISNYQTQITELNETIKKNNLCAKEEQFEL